MWEHVNEKTEYCIPSDFLADACRILIDFPEAVEIIEPVRHMEDELLSTMSIGGRILEFLVLVIDPGK